MLRKLIPREEGFFNFFQNIADLLVESAVEFKALLQNPAEHLHHVNKISDLEKSSDQFAYGAFQLLHKTFITPFDRNDIYNLISNLDDISDGIYRCALRFPFYNLNKVPAELVQLGECVALAVKQLKSAIYLLNSLQDSADILQLCDEVDAVESRSTKILLAGEKELFESENDFKTFFKLNKIYTQTKEVLSSCEDTANIIKGIVLEYS